MERDTVIERVLQRIERGDVSEGICSEFFRRCTDHASELLDQLRELYGSDEDLLYFFEDLLQLLFDASAQRPEGLRERDRSHGHLSRWYESQENVGAVCYADLFAGGLAGVADHIDYLKELGVTYLHLMPFFDVPEDENDGGYAVSSYRELQTGLGTIDDLRDLSAALHAQGISLVADFILNHTSDQHEWARRAAAGEKRYQDYYWFFPDRREPDEYQRTLRDIFPEVRKGSFTYVEEASSWVWTTFNSFQWDLNYRNHDVFAAMLREMLFLANCGVDVLRFDAIAFTWKEKGTRCESLGEVHSLIRAFRCAAKIAAPALSFKSEAIVHPREVLSYVDTDECELSYNPLLMAVSWEALATRDPRILKRSIEHHYQIAAGCSWVNYVRCHDDIGWTFDDDDARSLGIDPYGHRRFLNDFYTGRFPGSFARGLPFQENKETGDCRISGSCASLAGLEKGLYAHDEHEIDLAIAKIQLLYTLAATLGGIPLIYLGDELGMVNDHSYTEDPAKAYDSRWVHRMPFNWDQAARREVEGTIEYRIFHALKRLMRIRKGEPLFAKGGLRFLEAADPRVLIFERAADGRSVLVAANFSDTHSAAGPLAADHHDLITGCRLDSTGKLDPWQSVIIGGR